MKLKPESLLEMGSPSFIGKRQQHLYNTIETSLHFTAANANEKAGLTIFQSESNFYFLAKSVEDGKPVIQLLKSNGKSKSMELVKQTVLEKSAGNIYLKIEAKGDRYDFYYGIDNKNWILLEENVDAKFVSTKTAGGFVGCIYGMHATSSGKPGTNSASFKYLKYTGNDPMYR